MKNTQNINTDEWEPVTIYVRGELKDAMHRAFRPEDFIAQCASVGFAVLKQQGRLPAVHKGVTFPLMAAIKDHVEAIKKCIPVRLVDDEIYCGEPFPNVTVYLDPDRKRPSRGSMICCSLNGRVIARIYHKTPKGVMLLPGHGKAEPILLKPTDDYKFMGIVVRMIQTATDVSSEDKEKHI